MTWETPTFVEIIMSAEIGGYQSDFEDQDPLGPAVERDRFVSGATPEVLVTGPAGGGASSTP